MKFRECENSFLFDCDCAFVKTWYFSIETFPCAKKVCLFDEMDEEHKFEFVCKMISFSLKKFSSVRNEIEAKSNFSVKTSFFELQYCRNWKLIGEIVFGCLNLKYERWGCFLWKTNGEMVFLRKQWIILHYNCQILYSIAYHHNWQSRFVEKVKNN